MYWSSLGLALAIIPIRVLYMVSQNAIAPNFGPPFPEETTNTASSLRLNGVRDIAAGLTMLWMIAWSTPRFVGIIARGIA